MKKEDIYVKLTKKNVDKVISILKDAGCEYDFPKSEKYLKDGVCEELYLSYAKEFYSCDWIILPHEPNKTRIKPKQLRDILLKEWKTYKLISSTYDLKTGKMTFIVEKPKEYSSKINYDVVSMDPTNPVEAELKDWTISGTIKQLEIGKWYKRPCYTNSGFMFKFNGKFGDDVTIGFSSNGRYSDKVGVIEQLINRYEEATPEEVIEAFIYHMENFADKRRNITTAELRDILNQFHREEISFSKVVELVNEKSTK